MKVFATRVIPAAGSALLKKAGYELTEWDQKRDLTTDELIRYSSEHDALLVAAADKIDQHFLEHNRHLKVISLLSTGYDHVDVAAATRMKIPVGNTQSVRNNPTADTAFLLMLAVSRKAFYLHKTIVNGQWTFFDPASNLGIELQGKTLGILGMGKIGLEMARRCAGAYNMRIIYHNRGSNPVAEKELGAQKVAFNTLLEQSDVLSVHTALTPETAGIFNKAAFEKMKRSAIFVNTARGGIHCEADLIAALQNGVIWGAGLDVTNPEPMLAGNPLLNMPNVAVLPHVGSATTETRAAMSVLAAKNIIAAFNGERLPQPVNPEIYGTGQ
ncbi:2-hydroxyacid dehydrogenase [Deminuibacter soli]|uniref:Glyoxylate/hydroxypyruvate reductase B n=1 Tax=Deminuibacter soli TaxID=2291815 RepID=A0A3E1NMG4_9BACT|nr:D-glycerate dehydrogenase [Deminuibacter soli]RFM29024.1 D-glycerate dehydrogenase [Deminuibacter soli]